MSSKAILVVNSGSSSIKFAVFTLKCSDGSLLLLYRGKITGIGYKREFEITTRYGEILNIAQKFLVKTEKIRNHAHAFSIIFDWINQLENEFTLIAAGHRVVRGGEKYSSPIIVSKKSFPI